MYMNTDLVTGYIGSKISCFGNKTELQYKIDAVCGRDRNCFQINCQGDLSNHRELVEN